MKQYRVQLSQEQRQQLEREIKTGRGPARQLIHARILLKSDEGKADQPGPTSRSVKRSK